MTNDDGRKPEGAPERSPKAGAVPSALREWPEAFFRSAQDGDCRALLRGEPLELVARETNVSIARLSEWRSVRSQARLQP